MKPTQRRDYRSNARKPYGKQSGCTWCGGPLDGVSSYCSDACVQADHEGIDDLPPVMLLQPGNGPNSAYVARKIAQYNEFYGVPGTPSDDGDATGGGPYTSGSAIEGSGFDDD